MENTDKMAAISPVKLGVDSKFQFKCHKDVKCYTKCCRGISIILTPYDIIRLKNRLQLSSEEFLAIYTKPELMEKTDLPVITLKLLDDELTSCPFVRDTGCIVYEDRPTACRYYPLGVASLSHKEGADDDGFYFFVNEPHCLGFEEDREWTVKEWRKDQGVDIHDEINAEWTDLLVRKRSFPQNIKLTDKSKQLFFMVSYNIDKFKQFVFESTFLTRYDTEKEIIEKIKDNETALLQFGLKWLKDILFNYKNFEFNQEKQSVSVKE
ncbi:Putative zinc- or iron-chelating domain-containing protein [Desulfonema limicola]|uniref:Zinc- or iron-chelating domain-containing protein n=1 Tax=Desulfonema limicola TaxID=45656 RepID=A0A975B651_9BACT|nr:YkgJ family cysteine cluster protein [Desulfonema limicola]QTA79538.1 Putative zinc- or iron-chelating domain-containing protein [Desulfonema limicola]